MCAEFVSIASSAATVNKVWCGGDGGVNVDMKWLFEY